MCFRTAIDVEVHFDFASFIPKIAVAKNHDKFDRKFHVEIAKNNEKITAF